MEYTDVRSDRIAQGSTFRAHANSNTPHVRRIMRDSPICLDTVSTPLLKSLLSTITNSTISICFHESSHTNTITIFQVPLITNAMALPLSFFLYKRQEALVGHLTRALLLDKARCILPP